MPKETHYLRQRNGQIQIIGKKGDQVAFSFKNNQLGRMKALLKCYRLNNETDHITMGIFNHMVKIGKEHEIPEDFLPSPSPVQTRIVRK